MSDRSHIKNLDAPIEQVVSNLSDLRASRDPKNAQELSSPAETDLSQASIAASGVDRLSAKPDKRIFVGQNVSASLEQAERLRNPSTERAQKPHGVLNNPYYPYQGDLFSRLITLFANIFKALERLILRLLGGADVEIPTHSKQQVPRIEPRAPTHAEQLEKKRLEEERQRHLGVHRS